MKLRPAVLVALLALVPFGEPRPAVVEEVAAWVNGQIITRSDLLERERAMESQLSSRLVGDELDKELGRMRRTLLTDMIRETILLQRAEILGLELDKVYQQALNGLKEQQGIKTNEELDQVLKEEGITKEELRETLLRFNVPDIMVNLEVRDRISVSDEEVAAYFDQNREQFRAIEEFTVREIVLTGEGASSEELDRTAAAVLEDLGSGISFNELVVKYSRAPSRFKDGLIGPFKRGDLAPELETEALRLAVGEVSKPIRTKAGIHIIRLESHSEAKDPNLEDASKAITSTLKQQKFAAELEAYLKMLLETNRVEVNPLYKQYDQRS